MPEVVIRAGSLDTAETIREHIIESGVRSKAVEIRDDSEVSFDA